MYEIPHWVIVAAIAAPRAVFASVRGLINGLHAPPVEAVRA
jgi:hypothetical protein